MSDAISETSNRQSAEASPEAFGTPNTSRGSSDVDADEFLSTAEKLEATEPFLNSAETNTKKDSCREADFEAENRALRSELGVLAGEMSKLQQGTEASQAAESERVQVLDSAELER